MAFPSVDVATISVDTKTDVNADDGHCILREAVVSINCGNIAATGCFASGIFGIGDNIAFNLSLIDQAIGLDQGVALSIAQNVVIAGSGNELLTVDGSGNGSAGVFDVSNSTVELNGLTITGGRDSTTVQGGGISVSNLAISLMDSTVSGNLAVTNRGGIYIKATSSVSLTDSAVSENSAIHSCAGVFAIYSNDDSLANSTLSGNSAADDGGGISADNDSIITLVNSTLSHNETTSLGGEFLSMVQAPSN